MPTPAPSRDIWRAHLERWADGDQRVAQALAAWQADPSNEATWINALALAVVADAKAVRALTDAAPDPDGELALIHAMALGRTGATDEATARLDRVVFTARLAGDDHRLSWALAERGRAHVLRGRLGASAADFQTSLTLSQALDNTQLELIARVNLGFLHGREERPEPYATHTRAALALARRLNNEQAVAHCLCNLAGALAHLGRCNEAMACCQEARALAQDRGWPYVEALALASMGACHYRHPEPDSAAGRRLNEAAEALLMPIGREDQVMRHLYVEARHLLNAERPALALPLLERAVEGAERLGLTDLHIQAQEQRADVLEALGDAAGALATLREVVRLRAADRARLLADGQRSAVARAEAELQALKAAQELRARQLTLEAERQRLNTALEELKAVYARLAKTSRADPLTDLPNRRAGSERMTFCMKWAARHQRPFAVALLDVDHFKRINDAHGHSAGDAVLIELGRRLQARARTTDLVARWGGEEFLLLLLETDLDQAATMVDAVLQRVRARPFELPGAAPVHITASAGITVYHPGCDADALLRQADRALYAAKAAGRDRAERAAPPGE